MSWLLETFQFQECSKVQKVDEKILFEYRRQKDAIMIYLRGI